MEEKDLNNGRAAGVTAMSSKSSSKRRSASAAHRDPNQLVDAAARLQQWKRPNAQKHGAFAVNPTIPGENPEEFQELRSALINEWQPSGPTEEDAVFSLVDLMWRKRRAQKFIQTKLDADIIDPRSPLYDEACGLVFFACVINPEAEITFDQRATSLRAETINYLKERFPRSNYQSASEWIAAIKMEIKSVLLPAALLQPEDKIDDLTKALRKLTTEWKLADAVHHSRELLDEELILRERLDAMIHRQVKHLIQLKAMKQMLRETSAAREHEQPKRITARKGLQ
jgi:hypothetical protein